MFQFYRNLLGQQLSTRSPIDMEVIAQGNVPPSEQQVRMGKIFSSNDIKDVIWSIPNHKSPGLDSNSSGFFKSTWDQTRPLIYSVVQDFFQNSNHSQGGQCNQTHFNPQDPEPSACK